MNLIRLDDLKLSSFASRFNCIFDCMYLTNSLISDFVFVENSLFSQNYGLKRADNGLNLNVWTRSQPFETDETL
jgi:hypothetical protein